MSGGGGRTGRRHLRAGRLGPFPVIARALTMIALLCAGLWIIDGRTALTPVDGRAGVWDLTAMGPASGPVALRGTSWYIPGALLTPQEFEARQDEAVLGDVPDTEARVATSRMVILVPGGMPLKLVSVSVPTAESVFVNGVLIERVGDVGLTRGASTPGEGYIDIPVEGADGRIELVQQVSNFETDSWQGHSRAVIGPVRTMDVYLACTLGLSQGMVLFYITLALVNLLGGIVVRWNRNYLWAAAVSLALAAKTATTDPKPLFSMFPHLPWAAEFRLEHASNGLMALCFLGLFYVLFPRLVKRWFQALTLALAAFFGVAPLWVPTRQLSTWFLAAFTACVAAAVGILAVTVIAKLRQPSLPQYLFMIGAACFVVTGMHDLTFNHSLLPHLDRWVVSLGSIVWVLLQTMSVFVDAVQRSQAAEAEQRELTAVNAALERASELGTAVMRRIANDTRTPLAVIAAHADMVGQDLRTCGKATTQSIEDLALIAAECRSLGELIGAIRTGEAPADTLAGGGAWDGGTASADSPAAGGGGGTESAADPALGGSVGGRVLIVEDNRRLNLVNARALRGAGHRVAVAATLEQARTAFPAVRPDVILLDVGMPDGDGLAFAESVRESTDAHIVFVSARATVGDKVRGLMAGGDDYLTKPYPMEEMLSRVAAAVRRRAM
jgi:CheY-like chemotaxis protein